MEFSFKNYKFKKTKNYMKKNDLLLFVDGVCKDAENNIITKQHMKNLKLGHFKIVNRAAEKAVKKSIYKNMVLIFKHVTFIVELASDQRFKKTLMHSLKQILFSLMLIKLNNKIYHSNKIENQFSLEYKLSRLLYFQLSNKVLKYNSK